MKNTETTKLLEQNTSSTLHGTGVGKGFLKITPFAPKLRSTIYKWNLIKLKISCTAKEIIN